VSGDEQGHTGEACPVCGADTLVIEQRIEAKPIGSFSLAGAGMKFSATRWPWIRCTACGIEARGEVSP
jgi:hypothetical protein